MKSYAYLILSLLIFTSCGKDNDFEPQTEEDIIAYIEANDLDATRTNSGLYYVIDGEGMLLIPYNLGYGINGRSSIPGGAVLIFDIHLISVN